MKKLFEKIVGINPIVLCLMLGVCTFFSSCDNEDDDNSGGGSLPDAVVVFDTDGETGYYATVFDSKNSSITMVKADEDGCITAFDHLLVKENTKITATFNEDGLFEGIGVEGATIAFSNYNGNKVDVAVVLGDETLLFKEYECPGNWDSMKGDVCLGVSPGATRAEGKKSLKDAFFYLGNQFKNLKDLVVDGMSATNPKKAAFQYLFKVIKDGTLFVADLKGDLAYAEFFAELAALAASSPTTPWGALWTLLSNYGTYKDFVAEMVYNLIVMHEEYTNNKNNGIGALESGYGALKATLSWNFYADIDLYADEPSGETICWTNTYSDYSGGYLDVDNTYGGPGSVENIYWETAEDGDYRIYIDYYGYGHSGRGGETGVCTVSVFYNGLGRTYNIPMADDQTTTVTTVSLPSGAQNSSPARDIDFQVVLSNKARALK